MMSLAEWFSLPFGLYIMYNVLQEFLTSLTVSHVEQSSLTEYYFVLTLIFLQTWSWTEIVA